MHVTHRWARWATRRGAPDPDPMPPHLVQIRRDCGPFSGPDGASLLAAVCRVRHCLERRRLVFSAFLQEASLPKAA
jgi:hypothetical protein